MLILSGSSKNVNAIRKNKSILKETIESSTDITDTCSTDFFDEKGLHTGH